MYYFKSLYFVYGFLVLENVITVPYIWKKKTAVTLP